MFISIPIQILLQKIIYKNCTKGQNPVLQSFVTKSQIMQSSSVRGQKGQNHLHEKLQVTKTNSLTKAFDRVKVSKQNPDK